jgi:AraC-like DNA-binding protein
MPVADIIRRMRPEIQHIAPGAGREWTFQVRAESSFDFAWHAHDFYELTVITEGQGRRFTGDDASPYGPGDVALFGPRLPHTYASTPGDEPQAAYIAHFPASLVDRLAVSAEFHLLRSLLDRAARGVAFAAPDRSRLRALRRLATLDGPRQTIALLDVLTDLAEDSAVVTLASAAAARPVASSSAAALSTVIGHLDDRFREPIDRAEVAAAVSMSPSSVSRLMRRHLGTTLTAHITSLRIAAASRSLVDTDTAVAEIAHDCGFANLANFNRQFRRSQGMTPREYRRLFAGSGTAAGEDGSR